jgi:uncharacterized protein YbjT (DUF2867 family)
LAKSGAPYVILRPNWFADNFHTFWKAAIDHGQIALPAGHGKSSFIDARDVAECAATVLTTDRFDGKAFNLTGPKALGYVDAAKILGAVIGKLITYSAVDDQTFIGILTGAGAPDDYAGEYLGIPTTGKHITFNSTDIMKVRDGLFIAHVREGWTAAITDGVEALTGKTPRSLEIYASRSKSGWRKSYRRRRATRRS